MGRWAVALRSGSSGTGRILARLRSASLKREPSRDLELERPVLEHERLRHELVYSSTRDRVVKAMEALWALADDVVPLEEELLPFLEAIKEQVEEWVVGHRQSITVKWLQHLDWRKVAAADADLLRRLDSALVMATGATAKGMDTLQVEAYGDFRGVVKAVRDKIMGALLMHAVELGGEEPKLRAFQTPPPTAAGNGLIKSAYRLTPHELPHLELPPGAIDLSPAAAKCTLLKEPKARLLGVPDLDTPKALKPLDANFAAPTEILLPPLYVRKGHVLRDLTASLEACAA